MIKTTILTGLALVFVGGAVLADESWTVGGFNMPESAILMPLATELSLAPSSATQVKLMARAVLSCCHPTVK